MRPRMPGLRLCGRVAAELRTLHYFRAPMRAARAVRQVDEDAEVLPGGFFDGLDPDEEVRGSKRHLLALMKWMQLGRANPVLSVSTCPGYCALCRQPWPHCSWSD